MWFVTDTLSVSTRFVTFGVYNGTLTIEVKKENDSDEVLTSPEQQQYQNY